MGLSQRTVGRLHAVLRASPHIAGLIHTLSLCFNYYEVDEGLAELLLILPAVRDLTLSTWSTSCLWNQLTTPLITALVQNIFPSLHRLHLRQIQEVPFEIVLSRCTCLHELVCNNTTASKVVGVADIETPSSSLTSLSLWALQMEDLLHKSSSLARWISQNEVKITHLDMWEVTWDALVFYSVLGQYFGSSIVCLLVECTFCKIFSSVRSYMETDTV